MKQSTINNLLKLNKKLYESMAYDWSKTRTNLWEKPIIDILSSIKPKSSILDLGCGNARLYQIISKIDIQYLGLDSSRNFIEINKKNYPKTNFEVADALSINYHDYFDYIFSIAVLQHIPSEQLQIKFLSNCHKALKTNGKIIISVWNRHQTKYKKYFLDKKMYSDMQENDLIVPWKDTKYARYIYAFDIEKLKNLAEISGFKKIKCYYIDKNGISDKQKGLNILLIAQK